MRSFFLVLFYSASVSLPASAPEKLDVQDTPEIRIDPFSDGNSVLVTLTNHSGRTSTVSLRAGEVTTRDGLPMHDPAVTVGLPYETGATSRYSTAEELLSGESLTVQVGVTGFPVNGSYTVPLFNGSKLCGRIGIIGFPFRVHVNGPANGSPTVVLESGQSSFTLRNDDPLQYTVEWSLSVAGGNAKGVTRLGPFATEDVTVTNADCEGGQGTHLPVCLDGAQGFWEHFSSLLRDPKQDGRLTIRYLPPNGTNVNPTLVPHPSIPVSIVTHSRTSELTFVYGSCILFIVLALGSALSVFTNLWIPHSLRKNDICTRLMLLIRSIREISESIPSSARVSAEVEAQEILERLRNAGWFYSNFETVLRYYEAQTAALEARVYLLQQADEYHQQLKQLTDMSVPPTYLTRARLAFEPAMEVFAGAEWSPSQQELATALVQKFKAQVQAVDVIREKGIAPGEFGALLEPRFKRLKALFGSSTSNTVEDFQKMFPMVFRRLKQDSVADGIEFPDWAQIDYDLWKLDLIERFVTSYDGATSASRKDKLKRTAGLPDGARPGSLLYFLQLDTWDALRCAELICDEITQGIFPEDICEAIKQAPRRVSIKVRQKEIMAGRRVDCELCFANYSVNTATARREITPTWTFSSASADPLPSRDRGFGSGVQVPGWSLKRLLANCHLRTAVSPKTERGWVVSCLAPDVDNVQVDVCFKDWYGDMPVGCEQDAIKTSLSVVARDTGLRTARRLLEIGRSLVALAIPVIGLLAGARDKLLELDVSTALLAVFALGFSADSIKSALLRGTGATPKGTADSDAPNPAKSVSAPVAPLSPGLGDPGMNLATGLSR
jgi:hypothetical protein